jgi:UDP-glucuronate 4-epimerase
VKRALVTGAAGFIGSHLSERLIAEGWSVLGVDAFTPYYDRADKLANLSALRGAARFALVEDDLATMELAPLLRDVDTVFHLAAQPGVRLSFGEGFAQYTSDNILGTQRVLEAAAEAGVGRVVWASSSSVYGDAEAYPCVEDETPTSPRSPYGVTKRACEDLAAIYRHGGLSTVGLRYFTVYGPRQRPDMAMRKLCEALLDGAPFPLYGDGSQSRDFTHVADAVDATLRAGLADDARALYNVGGGHEATLSEIVALLEKLSGRDAVLDRRAAQAGDVRRTAADTSRARADLGWKPGIGLREGLRSQLEWVQSRRDALAGTLRFPCRPRDADADTDAGERAAATGGGGAG